MGPWGWWGSWDVALGYVTGLRWLSADLDPGTLVRTILVVHTCDAFLCRVIAGHKGYSRPWWTALGATIGVWAMACLLLLPARTPAGSAASAAKPGGPGD